MNRDKFQGSHYAFVFLVGTWVGLLFMALFLNGVHLFLWDAGQVFLQVDDREIVLPIERLPIQTILLVASFLVLTLVNEFFRKKTAIVLSLTTLGLLSLTWLFLFLLPILPGVSTNTLVSGFEAEISQDTRLVLKFTALLGVVNLFTCTFFEGIRKWTHSRFYFLRFFFSNLIAIVLATLSTAYLTVAPVIPSGEFLALWFTSLFQWMILFLLSLPFYYLGRSLLVGLVGSVRFEEVGQQFARRPIFSAEEKTFFGDREAIQEQRI